MAPPSKRKSTDQDPPNTSEEEEEEPQPGPSGSHQPRIDDHFKAKKPKGDKDWARIKNINKNKELRKEAMPFHLPGYNYCGPGTDLTKNLPPINDLDAACKRHDEAYADPNIHTLAADMNLAMEALGSDTYTGSIVSAAMVAKNILAPYPVADYFLRSGQNMEVDEVATEAQPGPSSGTSSGGDTQQGKGGGAGSSGGGEVMSLSSIATPLSTNRWTRVFRNRQERVLWNCKAQDWQAINIPDAGNINVAERRWTDYFCINDRILGFYITPTQLKAIKNIDTIAFKIKSAHWKILDSKVYVHSLVDGTTKYANYQGVDPYIYTISNPDYMPAYTWQNYSDSISIDGVPDENGSKITSIMGGECRAKYERTNLPRVAVMRPYNFVKNTTTGGISQPNFRAISSFTEDKGADFEYRHLTRILTSALPGSGRSLQTWPNWIRNHAYVQTGGSGNLNSNQLTAVRGTWSADPATDNYGLNAPANINVEPFLKRGFNDLGMYTMPIGPISEDPNWTYCNPWNNTPPDPYNLGRGNTPMWMKLEDIADPNGRLQEVSVVFTIETEIVIELADEHNACTDLSLFDSEGTIPEPDFISARMHRLLGDERQPNGGVSWVTKGTGAGGTDRGFNFRPNKESKGVANPIRQFGNYMIPYYESVDPSDPNAAVVFRLAPTYLHRDARDMVTDPIRTFQTQ